MLTIPHYSQKGTFERLVRARNGAMMRVRFQVYEVDGIFKGRVIGVEPVVEIAGGVSSFNANNLQCLPASCSANTQNTVYVSPFISIISPYVELYFFNSQPTRAPSRVR